MIRRAWAELPTQVRGEVERHTGVVVDESPAPAGRHSEFSSTLRTPAGRVFVKGITTDNPGVWAHRHEAAVNPRLPAIAPRLLWTVEAAGWLLLGYEHVDGRHADLSPGSSTGSGTPSTRSLAIGWHTPICIRSTCWLASGCGSLTGPGRGRRRRGWTPGSFLSG